MRNVLGIRNVWNYMTLRWLFSGLLAATLFAQGQQESAKPETAGDLVIRQTVDVVVAPVTDLVSSSSAL